MATSRVALIALRMSPGPATKDPQAIVIGTMPAGVSPWKKDDWRFVCYPLSILRKKIDDEADLLVDLDGALPWPTADQALEAAQQGSWTHGRLTKKERDAVEEVLAAGDVDDEITIPTSQGNKKVFRFQTAFPLRAIERAVFYARSKADEIQALKQPFSSFPTARVIDAGNASTDPVAFGALTPAGGKDVGSRVVLFPDFSDPKREGHLKAFTLHLEMRVAVNAHHETDRSPDPRLLLDAGAIRNSNRSLWLGSDVTRGAKFDRLRLRCTLGDGAADRSVGVNVANQDLLHLALGARRTAVIETDPNDLKVEDGSETARETFEKEQFGRYQVGRIPMLQALGLPKPGDARAHRRYAFRVLADEPRKITWRFELAMFGYQKRFGAHARQTLIPEWLDPKNDNKGFVERLEVDVRVTLAQEQCVDDIVLFPEDGKQRTSLTIKFTKDKANGQKSLDERITRHILNASDELVGRVQAGLKHVRDGRPLSLLPLLSPDEAETGPWHAAGFLLDPAPGRRRLAAEPGSAFSGGLVTFEPALFKDAWKVPLERVGLRTKAKFEYLVTADRGHPLYDAIVAAPVPQQEESRVNQAFQPRVSLETSAKPRGTQFGLELTKIAGAFKGDRHVLVGALELTLADTFEVDIPFEKTSEITLVPLADEGAAGHRQQLNTAIDAAVLLPIQNVRPGGQDESDRDVRVSARQRKRRDLSVTAPDPWAPLLLPLDSAVPPSSVKTTLKLTSEETVTRDKDHTIALSLRSIQQSSEAAANGGEDEAIAADAPPQTPRVLVIDPRPFRIAAVEYQPIAASATSESNEVAVWNAEGEGGLSWRVRDDGQSVGLELPPQVIGEAMEKNRSDLADLPKDIEPGKPSAARFGTPTRMRIDPTFAETRFREPGWNLRRILGNALQRLPGARLLDLRLELLYGLLTRIRTEGLWITELAGAIGEPALPLFETIELRDKALEKHKLLIDEVLETERFRLAIDKLYRTRPDEYLRIEEGASFKLRLKKNGGGPATPFRWPVPSDIPTDTGGLVKPEVLTDNFSTNNDDRVSFPGGLPWAFESANILMSVYGLPNGDGGNVGGIYLGPHGGYGSQRALFDERKTIVETETTQGRVHRYRLERVGRIGCLWHPAKHVIVYERTVVPPAQFYNRKPIGLKQDEHAGRAIPRKVEEYVEILKPIRHYPEDGTSVRASGCLVGAEFKSTKIHVDSSWGSDVRREGWQVPLWNLDFANLKPEPGNPDDPASIYPKPQIRLTFAGKDGDVVAEIDEPAKLVFYTSVVRGEDDRTDLWKPVRDVDFCDAPKVSVGRIQTQSEDLTDAILPPEPEHEPGYERFTIGLVPSKEAVRLGHGRVAEGPVATLRNVTLGRAQTLATDEKGHAAPDMGRAIASHAANVRAEIDRQVGRVIGALEKLDREITNPDVLQKEANDLIDSALARFNIPMPPLAVENLQNAIPTCDALKARARAHVEGQLTRLTAMAAGVLTEAANTIDERIGSAAASVTADVNRVDVLAAAAEDLAKRIEDAANETDEVKKRLLAEARSFVADGKARVAALRDEGTAHVDQVIATLKSFPDDLHRDLVAIQERASADMTAVRNLLGAVVKKESDGLEAGLKAVGKSIDEGITELQKAAGSGDKITKECQAKAKELGAKLGELRGQLREQTKRLTDSKAPDAILKLVQVFDRGLEKLIAFSNELQSVDLQATASPFLKRAIDLKDAYDTAVPKFMASFNDLTSFGLDAIDKIKAELDGVLERTRVLIEEKLVESYKKVVPPIVAELEKVKPVLVAAADGLMQPLKDVELAIPSGDAVPPLDRLIAELRDLAKDIRKAVDDVRKVRDQVLVVIKESAKALRELVELARRQLEAEIAKVVANVTRELEGLITAIGKKCEQLSAFLAELTKDARQNIERLVGEYLELATLKEELARELKGIVASGVQTIAELKAKVAREAARVAREAEGRVRQLTGALQQTVQNAVGADLAQIARRAEGVYQKGDDALRLIRAIGDPPKTDSLGFNRPEVAYVFNEARELGIDVTPTLALVNRAADQVAAVDQAGRAVGELLDSFGVRLPVTQIADQLIPQKLRNLSISDLLPDVGGIDFKGLLQRVGFPDLDDSDAVKVRHGFDQAARRAWMEADIDVPFAESVPLMSFGPVQIMIDTAKFESHARLSAGAGGVDRKMNGRIFGDWRIVSGGQTILTFRQTELRFDDTGKIDFQIQPERVELAEALKFITDLMRATGQKGGLRIEPLMRGGFPSGVAATLDMVLPPIQTGAFGISDLSLHVLFGVSALPRFEIISELAVGSRLTPFSLNVWILTGGGYLIQTLTYVPMAKPKPLLTYTLDIAVVAGLGIGFSFGVVSGGVWVQVGCGIALTWTTGSSGNTTTMRVFLLVRGNVDVAGLITASLALLFEISYDGERMIGAGTLTVRVKISEFYTLSVDEHVEYVFAGQKKQVGDGASASAYC